VTGLQRRRARRARRGRLALGVAPDGICVKALSDRGALVSQAPRIRVHFPLQAGEFSTSRLRGVGFSPTAAHALSLNAVASGEYFGHRENLGAVFVAAAMVRAWGMAAGPAIGGWIYDMLRSVHLDVRPTPARSASAPSPSRSLFRRFPRRGPFLPPLRRPQHEQESPGNAFHPPHLRLRRRGESDRFHKQRSAPPRKAACLAPTGRLMHAALKIATRR